MKQDEFYNHKGRIGFIKGAYHGRTEAKRVAQKLEKKKRKVKVGIIITGPFCTYLVVPVNEGKNE